MAINLLEHGYNDVNAAMPGEFVQLPAGGYVCKVFNAEITKSQKGNLMLVLFIDVAEGDFQGHFKTATQNSGKWRFEGTSFNNIFDTDKGKKDKIAPFFKGLLTCFEKSNPNLKLNLANFDPSALHGCLCGFIFAAEEKEYNGKVKVQCIPKFPRSVEDIRKGKFTVPELKKLQQNNSAPANNATKDDWGGSPVDPDDTPF